MSKFNFRERVLRAYAAFMRVVFPTHCVKSKTIRYREGRKNNNAVVFLPGEEKELKAIEKLHLEAEDIQKREWSYETRLALLKSGNFALISRINTEKELALVVEKGSNSEIIEAMKVCTPSKKFLQSLIGDWDRERLFAVIAGVPAAFDSLTAWEVLGVEEKKAYSGSDRWAVAQILTMAKPSWAPKFIEAIMQIVPNRLNVEAFGALNSFVEIAIEHKVDISNSIAYLMVFHPNLYVTLRVALAKEENQQKIERYVRVMFPQFISKLGKNFGAIYAKNGPSTWAQSEMKFFEETEAAVWLYFALRPATIDLVIDNLSEIKARVSEKTFQAVEDDVFTFSTGAREILVLMDAYKDDAAKQNELREKLLKVPFPGKSLRKFYPFKDWNKEQAEKAVRALAVAKNLPEELSELSEELQKVAIEELEIQSEIAVICGGTCGDKETLMRQKLHPRSEAVLFSHYYGTLESYAPQYIQNNRMSESAFKVLVSNIRDSQNYGIEECVPKLVRLHAEKWGLSEKNYKDLMQSEHYSKLAAVLKKYCKVESRQPSFEDGV